MQATLRRDPSRSVFARRSPTFLDFRVARADFSFPLSSQWPFVLVPPCQLPALCAAAGCKLFAKVGFNMYSLIYTQLVAFRPPDKQIACLADVAKLDFVQAHWTTYAVGQDSVAGLPSGLSTSSRSLLTHMFHALRPFPEFLFGFAFSQQTA